MVKKYLEEGGNTVWYSPVTGQKLGLKGMFAAHWSRALPGLRGEKFRPFSVTGRRI